MPNRAVESPSLRASLPREQERRHPEGEYSYGDQAMAHPQGLLLGGWCLGRTLLLAEASGTLTLTVAALPVLLLLPWRSGYPCSPLLS